MQRVARGKQPRQKCKMTESSSQHVYIPTFSRYGSSSSNSSISPRARVDRLSRRTAGGISRKEVVASLAVQDQRRGVVAVLVLVAVVAVVAAVGVDRLDLGLLGHCFRKDVSLAVPFSSGWSSPHSRVGWREKKKHPTNATTYRTKEG